MYCTAMDIIEELKIASVDDDTLIEHYIAQAQNFLEQHTARVFEASVDSTKRFDYDRDVNRRTLTFGYDCCAITSITNGDGVAVAATEYVTEPRNATPFWAVRLKTSSAFSWTYQDDPEDAIAVTGRWAYSITPPENVVRAVIRLAAYYYRSAEAQVFDVTALPEQGQMMIPKGIPPDVKDAIEIWRKHTWVIS